MDSIQCPHCGTLNSTARSLCENCQSPLTAYSGQLTGETYEGKLAGKVAQLNTRPVSVYLMVAFLTVVAIGWPLRNIVTAFAHRAQLNTENTNYLANAFGSIAPIMITIVMLPLACVLFWVAWQCYTQSPQAWKLSLTAVVAFATFVAIRFHDFQAWTAFWLVIAGVLVFFWLRPATRGWFGLS